MTVEMKIAYQRHVAVHVIETRTDTRHRFSGCGGINGNAHQLRTGTRELCHLYCSGNFIFRIGIGHGLHHHRRTAANCDGPYTDADTVSARRENIL